MSKPIVRILGTGGSIASLGPHRLDYTLYPEVGRRITVQESLDRIPEAKGLADLQWEDLASVGSGALMPKDWLQMVRRINEVFREEPEVNGIVLTHGTATLEETAYFLHLAVKSSKPVVVTGAMRPPSAIGTDADLNLYNAIQIAAHPNSTGRGVLTVLNNQIHSARDVIKTDTYRVETFRSYDMGLLGYADSDGQVVFYRSVLRSHTTATPFDTESLEELPRVDIVYSYTGADGLLVNAVIRNRSEGMIVVGLGSGTLPPLVEAAATEAVRQGITTVLASRVATGRVVTTPQKEKLGLVVADSLLPQKARVLLMLALTVTKDREAIQSMFYEF